jgi:hypothetical protein
MFPHRRVERGIGRARELELLRQTFARELATRRVDGWEVDTTEQGDPQYYLVGPPPSHHCLLTITRLGQVYVLEDGRGTVLCENDCLMTIAEQARTTLRAGRGALIARLAVMWCAVREAFEEKLEPVMGESSEILAHFAPYVGALA